MGEDKISLLIVDDEEAFLESMKKRLEVRGFDVKCVNRGDKAIEAARRHPVDIALVDLKMPGLSGEQTIEALKKEHEWMEVVILTGHGSIDSAVECTRSGAYSYLQKPCEIEHFLEVLKDAYRKRIMNKMQIQEAQMNALLQKAPGDSPLAILRRLKEMEKGAD